MQSRRQFLISTAGAAGTVTLLPYAAMAAGHLANEFKTPGGTITVHPVSHASFVMETEDVGREGVLGNCALRGKLQVPRAL